MAEFSGMAGLGGMGVGILVWCHQQIRYKKEIKKIRSQNSALGFLLSFTWLSFSQNHFHILKLMLRVLIYNINNWVWGRFLFYNNIIIFNESDLPIALIHGHIGIVGSSVSITNLCEPLRYDISLLL